MRHQLAGNSWDVSGGWTLPRQNLTLEAICYLIYLRWLPAYQQST